MKELGEALEKIRVVLIRAPEGKPKLVLETMGGKEARLFSELRLDRFVPA